MAMSIRGTRLPWNTRWRPACGPERDLIVVSGVQADRAEPLEKDGLVGKLGIDATAFAPDRSDWTRARPPEAVLARVRERIARRLGDSSAATPGRPWT